MTKQHAQGKYPLDSVPFEAFFHGSWHGVNLISIKNGCISIQLNYRGSVIEDIICGDYLRLRSRKARALDCSHILKTGVDVCVLSTHPVTESSDDEPHEPVLSWVDAKIMSIKKNHHEGRCACQFSVILNRNKVPTSFVNCASDRVTTEVVTIDRIAIFQKLCCEPREDGIHHWTSAEDWTSCKRSKLLTSTVSSEFSWLVVYSVLKGMDFDIKLFQNRVVYHVHNYVEVSSRVSDVQFDSDSEGISPNSEDYIKVLSFRRSNQTLKPKIETLSQVAVEEMTAPITIVEEDLSHQPVNYESDVEILYDYVNLRRSKRRKMHPERFTSYSEPNFNRPLTKRNDSNELEQSTAMIASLLMDEEPLQVQDSRDTNIGHLIEWLPMIQRQAEFSSQELIQEQSQRKNLTDANTAGLLSETPQVVEIEDTDSDSAEESSSAELEETSDSDFDQENLRVALTREVSRSKNSEHKSYSQYKSYSHKVRHEQSWKNHTKHSYKKKQLTPNECKQLLEKLMGSLESEFGSQHQPNTEQKAFIEEFTDFNWSPGTEAEEIDENIDLWKEMDDSLATLNLLEQKQKLDAEFFGTPISSDNDSGQQCQHVYRLDEQIGIVCRSCNFVCTEIRYVMSPMNTGGLFSSNEKWGMDDLRQMGLYNLEIDPLGNAISSLNMPSSEVFDSVWTPVSNLRSKLHSHQKRAFEFIWRNITGSLNPEKMNADSSITGGCVISHSPGSGKTLSVISFLVSYLRLYPASRPLIIAPKTAVYIWWKEFDKWGVSASTPVHLIHPFESYKKEVWDPKVKLSSSLNRRPNVKIMHIIDCLTKLKQWREKPGVLLMSYPAFFAFTFKESKFEYKKFMADVLLNDPRLLVLDEGHNPRSNISKLRKLLMRVNTEYRILLSGTLFQNNFEEYFNTLSLARPRFVDDVIRELDPRMIKVLNGRKQGGRKTSRKERLARKLFVEQIGQRIESVNEEDRRQGFKLLSKTTNGFIDSHDGDANHSLPGLQIYTLMLSSTDVQREVLIKLQNQITQKRCPLDLELLITVGSIHPWLITTVASVNDYFNSDELVNIEKYKNNFTSGSKVKFLVDLVHKSSIREERVLIFCHNIPPIKFLTQLFEDIFGWEKGKEVLALQGDQELFERGRIMNKFNSETKNKCKVLLASTLACAEGISLTAASRVVLLDSEWNHAKTRQAIARAFRPGQKKVVYVYRLLALDTWEEDKYNSNEWKAWLSKMIFLGEYIKFKCSKPLEVPEDDELLKELAEEDEGGTIRMMLKQD